MGEARTSSTDEGGEEGSEILGEEEREASIEEREQTLRLAALSSWGGTDLDDMSIITTLFPLTYLVRCHPQNCTILAGRNTQWDRFLSSWREGGTTSDRDGTTLG